MRVGTFFSTSITAAVIVLSTRLNIIAGKMLCSFIIVLLCAQGGSEIWMAESQTVIASLAFHPVDRMLVIGTYNELHFWDWSRPEPFAKCFTLNEREKIRSVPTYYITCAIIIYIFYY